MIYERRYIQFNDLVFDGFDMISDWDGDISFKGSSVEITYGHGNYRPFKTNYLYVRERNVSMTITLRMQKINCDYRQFYTRFVDEELAKPGKLWCVKNGELMWAVAAVESISENFSNRKDTLIYNINFVIPGGLWHKADKKKTFLVPWDVCTFFDCNDYRVLNPCDCCEGCNDDGRDCSCCCSDHITADMALCHHLNDLHKYYDCDVPYRIVYDCNKAEQFNDFDYFGQRLCVSDICESSIIAGRIYSETEIPTDDVSVILTGNMTDPWITINDNTNIIKGEYDGTLIIKSNGDVYYIKEGKCDEQLLDPSVWTIPQGNDYGWTIYPGYNRVVVHLNECGVGATCVYIQHDAIAL